MAETLNHYTFLVIGGGSGGIASARRAAGQWGVKTAVVEAKRWGGTCVNVGCVPKKLMWNAAGLAEAVRDAKQYGFSLAAPKFDWSALKSKRDAYIMKLNGIYQRNLSKDAIDMFEGKAQFVETKPDGKHVVKVNDQTLSADHVLIAVGSRPSTLSIPGGVNLTINSDDFFALEKQPSRVAVIGAGYIAVELASAFSGLGTETYLFTRYLHPLRKFDEMIQKAVVQGFEHSGVKHVPNSTPEEIVEQPERSRSLDNTQLKTLLLENGKTFKDLDLVLVATGRVPEANGLNLGQVGVEVKKSGHIEVDEYQNTSVGGIYALGDVCGQIELTPMAIAAGRRLADRLFGTPSQKSAKASYWPVPTVVFTHPPIGTIGFTEEEAKAKFGGANLRIYSSSFVNLYYGVFSVAPEEKPKNHVKLICLKNENDKIVGLHLYGPGSDEILQGFAVAFTMGATKADFDRCLAIHPTIGEELVTLPPWGLCPKL